MSEVTAKSELPKSYSPADAEGEILAKWERARAFHAVPLRDWSEGRPDVIRRAPGTDATARPRNGAPYCILIPPPNVTAALHLGHAFNNTIQDILTRYHRMRGFNTLWMPGTDHAGIATQTVVEKRLMQTEGRKRTDYSREEFVAKVQAWKDEYEATIIEQLKAMGASCDFERTRFTMDEVCAKAVREAFFRLFKDGLIYRGKRLVNWDPVTQTALADDEVEMEEVQGKMYYLRYPVVEDDSPAKAQGLPSLGPSEFVTVATTRPETMLGDTAVAINPRDPRAAQFRGKFVRLPIVNRIIPIIEDDYVVMPGTDDPKAAFATGFLKVTPAHDPNDWEIGLRHGLPVINVMAPDASISDAHGWPPEDVSDEARPLVGLAREEARKKVVEWFKANNLYEGDRDYVHSVGHSYRSHVPIEPYLSDQWYVRVTDDRMKGEALRAMAPSEGSAAVPAARPDVSQTRAGGTPALPARDGDDEFAASGSAAVPAARTPEPYRGSGVDEALTIHRRSRLPHWQLGGSAYYLTFCVDKDVAPLSEEERALVLNACLHWHGKRMHVHVVTVMPDHVHMIMTPLERSRGVWWSLPDLIQSIKGFTSHEINRRRGTSGAFWQADYFDRIIRNDRDYLEKWNYIVENPLRAGLVERVEDYPFTASGDAAVPLGSAAVPLGSAAVPAARTEAQETLAGGTPALPAREGDGELRFFPERYAKTFQQWHENLRDWCISRQLWWGHRIPVWTKSFDCYEDARVCAAKWVMIRASHNDVEVRLDKEANLVHLALREQSSLIESAEDEGFAQDPDVLDTWFSSGLWPLSTMGWPEPSAFPNEFPESAAGGTPALPVHEGDDEFTASGSAAVSAARTGVSQTHAGGTPALLDTFNPSSVLCTAREIITLWVSRMVMFNRYFRDGKLPFRHVYIHAMIQDGHGQKMSKSLGNSVDPRDIIHSHGADAMRFTLAKLATATQDVRMPVDVVCPHCDETFESEFITTQAGHRVPAPELVCPKCGKKMVSGYGAASGRATPTKQAPLARTTSRKFDEGRNFANKLWNAARFALSNLGEGTPDVIRRGDAAARSANLVDRWMLARLARTAHAIESALAEYQFHHYADLMYDLVWREFCDWYLEAIKPTVREDAIQQAVLSIALDSILRMLHPIMPFVTEAVWEHARDSARNRKRVAGVELDASDLCATAAWPRFDSSLDDEQAIATFERVRSLIESIRTIRGERNVPRKKLLRLAVGPAVMSLIHEPKGAAEVLRTLAMLERIDPLPETGSGGRPAGAIPIAFEGDELLLSGLVDEADDADREAERSRLRKFIAEKERAISGYRGRLENANYVAKAPPALVEETKQKLAEAEADHEAARRALESLEPAKA